MKYRVYYETQQGKAESVTSLARGDMTFNEARRMMEMLNDASDKYQAGFVYYIKGVK